MSCAYFIKVFSVVTIDTTNGCVDKAVRFMGAALTELRGFLREATCLYRFVQLPRIITRKQTSSTNPKCCELATVDTK